MKKYFAKLIALPAVAVLLFLQQGCVKDSCTKTYTYTYYQPVYKTREEVRANIKSNSPKPIVNPGKIYIKDNYIFLNEVDKGIHVIDNSNPATPKNIAFIDLPGNVDIAVKDNIMYADFYMDLVAIDISNPQNVRVTKFVDNVFPERIYYGYSVDAAKGVVCDWIKKTETVKQDCNTGSAVVLNYPGMLFTTADAGLAKASPGASPVGISGSLARFALIGDYLYTVSTDNLNVISLTTPSSPVFNNKATIGNWHIETIYPFKDKLFIGSNNGMYVYGLQNPAAPAKISEFTHARACDPVIADNNYAYITLRTGSGCLGIDNDLEIVDITNLGAPVLKKTYPMTNPHGLSKDGDLLFICDGDDGLRIYNGADPYAIVLLKQFKLPEANDVIAFNHIALVIAKDGLYQYDYTTATDIKLISKISLQ